jgi:late competence protein required for DNA uptake (superfamily II DNA/RNA helicase)
MNGKGDRPRLVNQTVYDRNYDAIFNRKELSIYHPKKIWECEKCGYEGEAQRGGSCGVLHFYCRKCGELMWEKDVS